MELIAAVVSEGGQASPGIVVTFSADQGTLSNPNAVTNASGEARTQLTTSQQAVVSGDRRNEDEQQRHRGRPVRVRS